MISGDNDSISSGKGRKVRSSEENNLQAMQKDIVFYSLAKQIVNDPIKDSDFFHEDLLESIATLLNGERIVLFQINADNESFSVAAEWYEAGLSPIKQVFTDLSFNEYQLWRKFRQNPHVFQFGNIENIPDSFQKDKNLLLTIGAGSFMQVPVIIGNSLCGFLFVLSSDQEEFHHENDFEYLLLIAGMLGKVFDLNLKSTVEPKQDETQSKADTNQVRDLNLLAENKEQLDGVFSGINFGIAFFDTVRGIFLYHNQVFSLLMGFDDSKPFSKDGVYGVFDNAGYDTPDFFSEKTAHLAKDFSLILMDKYIIGNVTPVQNTSFITVTLNDISPLTIAEKEEKEFNQQLRVLSEAAINLMHFQNNNIYKFIGDAAYSVIKDGILLVNAYDYDEQALQTKYVKGIGLPMEMIARFLGKHPLKKKYPLDPTSAVFREIIRHPVYKVKGGLRELSFGTITEPIARQIEKLTATKEYYACGLFAGGRLYGTLAFLLPEGVNIRTFVLETISRMASTALHTQTLSKELEKTTNILSHATRIAKMGHWQLDLNHNKLVLSKDLVKDIIQDKPLDHDSIIPVELFLRKYVETESADLLRKKLELARRNMNTEGYSDDFEWTLKIKGREPFYIYSRGVIQRGGWVLGIAKDITSEKIKNERDKQMEIRHQTAMAKQMFLDNMSHEMRTPLNGIIGMTDLLSHAGLNPYQQELLSVIKESSDSLLELISNIHELSRIEAERIVIQHKYFNPSDMLVKTIGIFKAAAHQKEIQLKLENLPDQSMCLVGDEFRLQQILTNLIANALKFTPNNGTVHVEASTHDQDEQNTEFKICVSDTGIGIAEEKIQLLFERFTQVDSSFTREYEGAGIGLSISKELIELMGGEIGVSSKPGRGSIFWIKLVLPRCL